MEKMEKKITELMKEDAKLIETSLDGYFKSPDGLLPKYSMRCGTVCCREEKESGLF